ncbi:transport and Golgi organization protein 1 homolog isoform X2 [Lethenteron reissneri]|uniref:transport and Golgi organization protein 1 homolog isoform X2 n=1 Tax=Lethenteron reissneri TaxID=7753 RepID=UPI002AB654B3|nr:transport and Golgi organization protein 1 homolog isoform X2 [Lethenteron reissneri]
MEPEEEDSDAAKPTAADEQSGMLEREKLSNYAEGENEISKAKEKLILAVNKGISGEDDRLHDALNSEYLEIRDAKAEMDLNVNKKRFDLNDREGKDVNVEPEKEANSDVAKPTAGEEQSGMLEREKQNKYAEGKNEISEAKGKLILAINKAIAEEDERLHDALNSEYLGIREAKVQMDLNVVKKPLELNDHGEKDIAPKLKEILDKTKPSATEKVTEGNDSHEDDVAGTLQKKDVAQDIEIQEAAARVRLTMKRALAVDVQVSPADFKGDVAIQKEKSQLDSELENAWYQVDDDLKDTEDLDDGDANDEAEQTVVTKERIKVSISQSKHGAGIKETQLEKNADHEEDLSGKEGLSEKDVPIKQSTLDVKIREDLKMEQLANKADLEMLAEQGNENVVKSEDLARDEEDNEEPQEEEEEQVDKEEVDKLKKKDLKGRVELNDDEDFEDTGELEEEETDPEPADEELYYLDDEEQEDQKPVEEEEEKEEEDEDKLEAPEDEEVKADVSSSVNVAEDHKQIGNASNDDGDVESDDPLNDFDEELYDDDESDSHRVDDNMTNEMDDLSETELLEDENALAFEVGDDIYLKTDHSRSDENISQITTAEDEVYPDVLEQTDLGNEQNVSAKDNIIKEEIETLLDVDDAHADEKRRVPTGNSDSENDESEGPSPKPDDGPPEFEQTVVEDYLSEERQSRLRRILRETKLSALEDRLRAFEGDLADSKMRAEGTMEDVEKSLDSVMDRHEGRVLQWLQEVLEDIGKQHEEAEEGQDLEEEEEESEEAYEERVEVFNDVQDVVFAMRKRFSMSMESVPIAPGAKVKVKVVQDKFSWLPSDKNGTLPDLILRMDSAFLYVRACVLPSLGSLLGMVASQLPAEWRPGPSYHGVPWDVVATGLCLGIAFSLAFLWRLICVFQNRRYLRREARHIQTVKTVLEEKHELAERLANARKEIHGKASSLDGILEGSKGSKQAIAKLQTEHRELQESICERRSEMEAIRRSLESMQQHWEQQHSLKLRLQRSTESVEQTLGSLKAELEAVLSRVGTANSNNDKMEAKLVKMEKENEQLQRSNRRLDEEVELCDTSVGELTETLHAERQMQKSLEEAVAFKQNEVEAMTACLNQLKDLGVDSESLDESEKRKQKQKLQELMDVSKVNVMLRVVEEEIEEYGSLLRDEVAATHKLEGTLEAYENKNASLAAEKGNLCEELARCKQKLHMVKQMYEEKEVKLQRKLTLEETHREQNKGKLSAVDERVLKAIEDASIHRRKVEDLREELNKTEKNYKDQISTNEKKVHENWLKARTAEREMVASKKEVSTLKERMSDIELKLALLHRPPTYRMDFQRGLPLQPLVVPTHRGASLRDGSSFASSPVSGPPSPPMLTDEPRRGPTRAPGQPRRTPRAADNGPSSPLDSTDGLHNPIPAGRPPELRASHGHVPPPPGPHEPAYPRHSPPRGQHIPPAQAGPRGGPQTSPLSAQGTPPQSARAAYGFPQRPQPAGPTAAAASASQNGMLRGQPGPGLPPTVPAAPYGPPLSPALSGGLPPMQRQFYPPPPQGAPGAPAQGQLAPPQPLVPYDSQPSQGRRNPPPLWQGAPGQHPPQGSAGQRPPPPRGPPGQPPMLGPPPGQHLSQGPPGHPPPQGARGQPPSQVHPGHRPPQGPPGQPPHLHAEPQLQHSQAPQSPPLSQAPRMPPPSQGPFAPPPWQGIRGPPPPHPPASAQGFHGRPSLQELRPQHRPPPPPASTGVRSSAPNSRGK